MTTLESIASRIFNFLAAILTEISGEDRQMLSRIARRPGSLSDELKKAVLRVMG